MWKREKEIHHKEWVHGIMEADKPADLQLASWGRRDPLLCFYFLVSRKPAGSIDPRANVSGQVQMQKKDWCPVLNSQAGGVPS